MQTIELLRDLIAFPTVSADPNRALIDYCADLLKDAGADIQIIEDATGKKANLFATIGPRDKPGIMLSGHTDVVPVAGQNWTVPAFEMTTADGKAFGRGTTDMKGFVASTLRIAHLAAKKDLKTPLHVALSYDEEIGCIGVRSMIDMLATAPVRPKFCIVGEPTQMAVGTGHKGKTACRVTCTGREGHSALAPFALNAIHLATDVVTMLRAQQARIAETQPQDSDYDVPYTTVHVGRIDGGMALNIVPNACTVMFEIRNLHGDDPTVTLSNIRASADQIVDQYKAQFPEAAIDIEVTNTYPALGTSPSAEVVSFVKSLTGANGTTKVTFGTEGGLFDADLGIPTVVCGPGSMAQGHKPDEFVSLDQLAKCDAMLDTLLERLIAGI